MEALKEGFSAFILGFFRLIMVSLGIWMAGLLLLLFRELFSARQFQFQDYLKKLWKLLIFAFEGVAYGGIIIAPIILFFIDSGKKLDYIMVWIDAVILSAIYFYVRKQTGTLSNWRNDFQSLFKKVNHRRDQDRS
ncbi:hypothetical protein [Thermoflavimicrobium daqui]|uniref:Uncharacterized protein n=1 Tax=Thermoflavimicrobium daqui TaxID=2137476 RepID=A0A364K600_9BACL|nr:hypothetical protein [Thermoflavimicrobium daqui]RAL25739.1 hypothetical protein DL897_06595 [Thermoflavimicrobium daqui]